LKKCLTTFPFSKLQIGNNIGHKITEQCCMKDFCKTDFALIEIQVEGEKSID
jgi:hypothetical protein